METCRVLWLDVKGTTFGMLKEPERLRERLSHFYKISEAIPSIHGSRLGRYRAYNFSDTLMLTVFSREHEISSNVLVEVALDLIGRCQANEMRVRGFLTTGVEADAHPSAPPPAAWTDGGSGEDRYRFLFGVNTAVMAAYLADGAHLPGTLFADDMIWKQLGCPSGDPYAVASNGEAFRRESNSRWVSVLRPSASVSLEGPYYEFHRLR